MTTNTITLDHYGRITVPALPARATAQDLLNILRDSGAVASALLQNAAVSGADLRSSDRVALDVRAAAASALAEIERRGPVRAEVAPASSGVGWVARVTYVTTGRDVPRAADEGGEHQGPRGREIAVREAETRAMRATGGGAGRIVRVGYATQS